MHKYPSALIQSYWYWSAYGGAITKEDVQLPITARPEFAGSVVMYKAANLEAVWEGAMDLLDLHHKQQH